MTRTTAVRNALLLTLLVAACAEWKPRPSPNGWSSCSQSIDGPLEDVIERAHAGSGDLLVSASERGEIGEYALGVFDDGEVVLFGGRGMRCCGLFARKIGVPNAYRLRNELADARPRKDRVPADAPVARLRLRHADGSVETIIFSTATMTPVMERMWRRLHETSGTANALRALPQDASWPEPGTCEG